MRRRYDNSGYYSGKVCPRCGCPNCQIINESTTTGGDYGVCSGICGYILMGPVGLLCGLCGMDTKYDRGEKAGHLAESHGIRRAVRMSSAGGQKLFYRTVAVSCMRKMHRCTDRAYYRFSPCYEKARITVGGGMPLRSNAGGLGIAGAEYKGIHQHKAAGHGSGRRFRDGGGVLQSMAEDTFSCTHSIFY